MPYTHIIIYVYRHIYASKAKTQVIENFTVASIMEKTSKKLFIFNLCIIFGILVTRRCNATTYFVGDTSGWDISSDLESWPLGKRFSVGDVLSKYYNTCIHWLLKYIGISQYFTLSKTKNIKIDIVVSWWKYFMKLWLVINLIFSVFL